MLTGNLLCQDMNDAPQGQTTKEEQERVAVDAPMQEVLEVQQQMIEAVSVILQEHLSEPTVEQMVGGLAPLTADAIVEVWQRVSQGCIHEIIPKERISKRHAEQNVDGPVSQSEEQTVDDPRSRKTSSS